MAQGGLLVPVISTEGTNFTQALAINVATPMNNLPMPAALMNRRCILRAITVISKENYGPEFNFFSAALGITADPATDAFIARFGFVSAMGQQFAGAGLWRYYIDGLAVPYFDLDTQGSTNPSTLHVAMCNRSATPKSADVAGQTQVIFYFDPENEW